MQTSTHTAPAHSIPFTHLTDIRIGASRRMEFVPHAMYTGPGSRKSTAIWRRLEKHLA
jgi:hypothetical protein